LGVANIFLAGDGNMHPLILFDANEPGSLEKVEAFGADILRLCVEVGGCLTGEHGVGVEKRDLMTAQFTHADMAAQMAVKDVFDPAWLLNPGKVFPLATVDAHRAGERLAAE
jgi:glycolate oxidase